MLYKFLLGTKRISMKNVFVLLVLFVWTHFVSAQPHVNWINYSFSQRVTDIDIKGDYLWISTQGGLVKYNKKTDEKTFYNRANANLPDNNLLGVFCAENGNVWITSKYYGIGNLNNSICVKYNQSNSGLPFDQLNAKIKLDNKGNVWIASFRWMAKFNGKEWKTWITGSDISSWPLVSDFDIADDGIVWLYSTDGIGKIEKDEYTIVSTIGSGLNAKTGFVKVSNDGSIWIAIENEGIYKYDGSSFTNYNTSNSCLPTNTIYAIDFDSDNKIWLATNEGLILFNSSNCTAYQPIENDKALLTLECDEDGSIWCGTISGKLLKFNGTDFLTIGLSNSPLKSNYAAPLLYDAENNIWIGTQENIVKKTLSGLFSEFERSGFAAIQNDIGDIWIGFIEGDTCMLKITGDENIVLDSLNSPFSTNHNAVASSFAFDNVGNLWISTRYNGLFKYDGTNFTNFTTDNSDIPSNEVTNIVFDDDNNLWGGSAKGLFKFNGTNWSIWNKGNSSIPTNMVNQLIIDSDDKIWFSCMDENRIVGGEYGGGLTKFDGQIMTIYNMSNSGLMANTIFGIREDRNKLWIATCGAGLINFDKTEKWEIFDVTNSGIANNIVQGLVIDKKGNIWMGHNDAGVSVFNPDSVIQTGVIIEKSDDDVNSKLIIYPNPVRNELFVKINLENERIIKADIYDVSGRLMQIIPEYFHETKSSAYCFQLQSCLPKNQILILSLKADNGNVFKGRFIISK